MVTMSSKNDDEMQKDEISKPSILEFAEAKFIGSLSNLVWMYLFIAMISVFLIFAGADAEVLLDNTRRLIIASLWIALLFRIVRLVDERFETIKNWFET